MWIVGANGRLTGLRKQVDKVIEFMKNNREDEDDTELLFKSYPKKLKNV